MKNWTLTPAGLWMPDGDTWPADANSLPINHVNRPGETWFGNGLKISPKYWIVEVQFTTPALSGTPVTINIPLNNTVQGFLLGSYYWSIEAYSAATLPNAPSGVTVIPQAAFTNGYMQLSDGSAVQIWNPKPLRDLQTINDTATLAGKSYPDSLGGVVINWANSAIILYGITSGILNSNTKYSIPLGLAFSFNSNWKADGIGKSNYAPSV